MNLGTMTTAVLAVVLLAFVCEVTGLLYCAIRNIPFGRPFGIAVFTQISIPATLFAVVFVFENFSPSTGALGRLGGTGFDRGLHLYFLLLISEVAATVAAGSLGLYRILLTNKSLNA